MNETLAIGFSLSKAWKYKDKKEAIERAGSFDAFIKESYQTVIDISDMKVSENQFKKFEKHHAWLWIYGSEEYPKALATISNPPLVIYGLGCKSIVEDNLLAMVGTRNPTAYGKRIGLWLARDLIREGLTLVSGLARGIDSLAHQASIDAKAETIAVLAHGLDMVYPPENKKMRDNIIALGGTVISEYPFGIRSLAEYFPQRNRIISGLSKGTLVIEAAEQSGTRHTVNHALDQAREVFSVPGPVDSKYSIYPNELIFNGANMVRTCEDILSFYPNRIRRESLENQNEFKPNKLQRQLLEFLDKNEAKPIEEFLSITTFKPKDVLQGLTELELHDVVVKQPDSTYVLSE